MSVSDICTSMIHYKLQQASVDASKAGETRNWFQNNNVCCAFKIRHNPFVYI